MMMMMMICRHLGESNVQVCVCWVLFFVLMQIKSECLSCRNSVAVFDMSYFGKFYLTGPDAKKAADWLFTADVNKKPGQWWLLVKQSYRHTGTRTMHRHGLMGKKVDRRKKADWWEKETIHKNSKSWFWMAACSVSEVVSPKQCGILKCHSDKTSIWMCTKVIPVA